ncbi:nicotinate-nucleotide adenylyltransferase [Rhodobacteraceae bacterium F11138]|nr:nicotinate-nucleotide adenylyltransferase [Rhodobacteraceae bacterium F11138]
MDRAGFPLARAGMNVGLFGGSFDPPHAGHVHVTREALKRFSLDRIWWLVSPGNPLKEHGPAPLMRRMTAARTLLKDPRVTVSDLETRLGTRATADTITRLQAIYPGVRFVWLMGADNLAQFHKWQDWRRIMQMVPVGVLARPGDRISARMSPAAWIYRQSRVSGSASHALVRKLPPAWCFVNLPMIDLSSSAIRAQSDWR